MAKILMLFAKKSKIKKTFEEEQDYFDWELAITGVDDMKKEIEHLASVRVPS